MDDIPCHHCCWPLKVLSLFCDSGRVGNFACLSSKGITYLSICDFFMSERGGALIGLYVLH